MPRNFHAEVSCRSSSVAAMSTADKEPDSLVSALNQVRIPTANHAFIQRITDAIGISGCHAVEASTPYVCAFRQEGAGELHIFSGYTRGLTEAEATRVGVQADVVRQSTANKTWIVSHPEHGDLGSRSGPSRRGQREGAICDGCGEQLPLTGVCYNCDD